MTATSAVGPYRRTRIDPARPQPGQSMFRAPAVDYDRYMGRYVPLLAQALADAAGVRAGQRVLDVGCGPGGLTGVLARRVGAERVSGIDPAPQFAQACRERYPGVDVRDGVAEQLPWPDSTFDAVLSCLAFGFFRDPDAAVAEMIRVARPGGVVVACMWDIVDGGMSMLRIFWEAMRAVVGETAGEAERPGTRRGDIADRFRNAGLLSVSDGLLGTRATYTGFDDFFEPLTLGIGTAGGALSALGPRAWDAVRRHCRDALPPGPFTLDARAWYAAGRAPGR